MERHTVSSDTSSGHYYDEPNIDLDFDEYRNPRGQYTPGSTPGVASCFSSGESPVHDDQSDFQEPSPSVRPDGSIHQLN